MVTFTQPANLNGKQLLQELANAGIKSNGNCLIDEFDVFWVPIDEKDKTKAEPIVAAHIAVDENVAKEAAQAKLAALGLTADDLKALGL